MPLFDFKCPECGTVREVLMRADTPDPVCRHPEGIHNGYREASVWLMEKQPSSGSFVVKGFNSLTGYASPRTFHRDVNGIKTTVTGNPEAFADGLV